MTNDPNLFGVGPVFPVPNLQKAALYYHDKLGFDIEFVESGHGSVTRCGVGVQFTESPPGFDARSYPGWTYIFVEHIDSLFDELKSKGATITAPLRSHDHGMREFQIEDLNGYKIRFGQYIE